MASRFEQHGVQSLRGATISGGPAVKQGAEKFQGLSFRAKRCELLMHCDVCESRA